MVSAEVFLPSLLTSFPFTLHLFLMDPQTSGAGVGGGALGFVPSAEIQRQEIHYLPSRSSHSSWGAGQRGPGFLHGGDGLAGRGWLGAGAELEHSGTSLSKVVGRLRLECLPKYGLWMSARINQSGPIDCAP